MTGEHSNVLVLICGRIRRALDLAGAYLLHGDPVKPETAAEIAAFADANPTYREYFDFARTNHFSDAQVRRMLRLARALVEDEQEANQQGRSR